MATMNVTECAKPVGGEPLAYLPGFAGENVTITGTSAQSSAFNDETRIVRVVADAACYVLVGSNPTAAAGDVYLPANAPEYFRVTPGQKIAGITA